MIVVQRRCCCCCCCRRRLGICEVYCCCCRTAQGVAPKSRAPESKPNPNPFHSVLFNLLLPFQSVGQPLLPMYENTALTMRFFALRADTARTAILKLFKIRQGKHFQPTAAADAAAIVLIVRFFFFFFSQLMMLLLRIVVFIHNNSVCPYVCSSLGITQYNHISMTQDYSV